MKNEKTVYFLGAGFSCDAGGPIQNGILKNIFSDGFAEKFKENKDITTALEKFNDFIAEGLLISLDKKMDLALEDVFTPLDRCINDNKSFKEYSVNDILQMREQFHLLMAASIHYGVDLKEQKDKRYIDKFAKYVDSIAYKRIAEKKDKISVITTNWDILLDNRIKQAVETRNNENNFLSVVDYCCYMSSLENDESIKPGLLALGNGGYNVKYLKLHGSMNWLHCPMCQRMYIKFGEKIMFNEAYCKHCKKNHKLEDIESVKLKSNLLLPTFLKDLSNIQIQLVWQNAAIELSEASKIVFIGYSLPAADFEVRQLLSRTVRKDAKIEVVLYPGDKNENGSDAENRYRTFFGKRIDDKGINYIEVPAYVKSLKPLEK